MNLGKSASKLSVSFSQRRIRLGVSHSGGASSWVAPAKDRDQERTKRIKTRK
jgi:hypothetical protein